MLRPSYIVALVWLCVVVALTTLFVDNVLLRVPVMTAFGVLGGVAIRWLWPSHWR